MRLGELNRVGVVAVLLLAGFAGQVAAAPARSGHIVANTRRTVQGKAVTTVAELWYTSNRYRLVTRQGALPAHIQVYNGEAVHDWTDGSRSGQRWHPTALNVAQEVVRPILAGAPLAGRKRVGTGKVLGIPCGIVQGTRTARRGAGDWWRGSLRVRLWESQDPRFPYALRADARDGSGNQANSEVTELDLSISIPPRLFQPPANVAFYRPAQVRSGWRVAGGPVPVTGTVAFHLADALSGSSAPRGRGVVRFAGRKYALDRQPLATRRDVDEVRVETQYRGDVASGMAIMLYLRPQASARLARASGRARGRHLVIILNGKPAAAPRINGPWAVESNSFAVTSPSAKEIVEMANKLGMPAAKRRAARTSGPARRK